jgi:exonuclease III
VGVQEVRWDGGGTEPAGEYTFFYGKGNENQRRGMHIGYWWESQKVRDHWEDLDVGE